MSVMVAEPDSIPSKKRISLLHKEQITDKNSMIHMNLDTFESMITMKQNLDIPISEMMKQMVEVTKTISQKRLQQYTQEQTSDSNALSRDRPQRLHDVIVETVQDSTNETRNTGTGTNEDQMMTERVTVVKGELLSERECDISVLIKQIYTGFLTVCPSVFCVSPACSVCWNAARDRVEHCRMSLVRSLRKGCPTAISKNRTAMKLWI